MRITVNQNRFLLQSRHEKEINVFICVLDFVKAMGIPFRREVFRKFETNMYGGRFVFKKGKWQILLRGELVKDLVCFFLHIEIANKIVDFMENTLDENIQAIDNAILQREKGLGNSRCGTSSYGTLFDNN